MRDCRAEELYVARGRDPEICDKGSVPLNRDGPTPTMVNERRLITIDEPTIAGSDANRRRHNECADDRDAQIRRLFVGGNEDRPKDGWMPTRLR
jgi:hypothetical protein